MCMIQINTAVGVFIYYFSQAYVFDVEDEYAESDIPTTLIRSKADCPGIEVSYGLALCFCMCDLKAIPQYCIAHPYCA